MSTIRKPGLSTAGDGPRKSIATDASSSLNSSEDARRSLAVNKSVNEDQAGIGEVTFKEIWHESIDFSTPGTKTAIANLVNAIGTFRIRVDNAGAKSSDSSASLISRLNIYKNEGLFESTTDPIKVGAHWEKTFQIQQQVEQQVQLKFKLDGSNGAVARITIHQQYEQIWGENLKIQNDTLAKASVRITKPGLYLCECTKLNQYKTYKGGFLVYCFANMQAGPDGCLFRHSADHIGEKFTSPPFMITAEDLSRLGAADGNTIEFYAEFGSTNPLDSLPAGYKCGLYRIADETSAENMGKKQLQQLIEVFEKEIFSAYKRRDQRSLQVIGQHLVQQIKLVGDKKLADLHKTNQSYVKQLTQHRELVNRLEAAMHKANDRVELDVVFGEAQKMQFDDIVSSVKRFRKVLEQQNNLLKETEATLERHFSQIQTWQPLSGEEVLTRNNVRGDHAEDVEESTRNQRERIHLIKKIKLMISRDPRNAKGKASEFSALSAPYLLLLRLWQESVVVFFGLSESFTRQQAQHTATIVDNEDIIRRMRLVIESYMQLWTDLRSGVDLRTLESRIRSQQNQAHVSWYKLLRDAVKRVDSTKYVCVLSDKQRNIAAQVQVLLEKVGQSQVNRYLVSQQLLEHVSSLICLGQVEELKYFLIKHYEELPEAVYARASRVLEVMQQGEDYTPLLTDDERARLVMVVPQTAPTRVNSKRAVAFEETTPEKFETAVPPLTPVEQLAAEAPSSNTSSGQSSPRSPSGTSLSSSFIPVMSWQWNGKPNFVDPFIPLPGVEADKLIQEFKDVVKSIIAFFKSKKEENSSLDLATIGDEADERMEIGQIIRKRFMPIFEAIFRHGIRTGDDGEEQDLWQMLQVICHTASSSSSEEGGGASLEEMQRHFDQIAQEGFSSDIAQWRAFWCLALNSKLLPVYLKNVLTHCHIKTTHKSEALLLNTQHRKNLLLIANTLSKLPFKLRTDEHWNYFNPLLHS